MQAAQERGYEVNTTLYMAMELSNSKWKLGFGNGAKIRRKTIDARDKDGNDRWTTEVVASDMQMLGGCRRGRCWRGS